MEGITGAIKKNVDIEISVRLLINSIGFFNIIQNVF